MNTRKIVLPRQFVLAALACVYALAFLVSPYWKMTDSPGLMVVLLAVIVGLGVLWVLCAGAPLEVRLRPKRAGFFAVLFIAVLFLNFRTLNSGIPWRGDEAINIDRVLVLVNRTPLGWMLYLIVVAILFLAAAWRGSKLALLAGAGLIASAIVFGLRDAALGQADPWILKYPLFNFWIFMLAPKLAAHSGGQYNEILYRLVPLAAMSAVAWSIQRELDNADSAGGLLWGFGIATMPVVFYYSSILYTEPTAVWLMLLVCLNIRELLQASYKEIRSIPAWHALILIGFIRETTLPFLLFFVTCRIVQQLHSAGRAGAPWGTAAGMWFPHARGVRLRQLLASEARIVYATCLPIGLFFVLRSTLASVRTYTPDPHALLDLSVYRSIGQSFVEQFGVLLIFFAAGCVLLARRREVLSLAFLVLIAIMLPLVSSLDRSGIYAGYSRFNLLVVPAILAGAVLALKPLVARTRNLAIIPACFLIAVNLIQSPINLDGTKQPLWGNYRYDTSEHYYPLREALTWLKEASNDESIFFARPGNAFALDFYFNQLEWHPRYAVSKTLLPYIFEVEHEMYFSGSTWHPRRELDTFLMTGGAHSESAMISETLQLAADGHFEVVVYQILGSEIPKTQGNDEFQFQKLFINEAHAIVVFFSRR